MEKKKKEIKDKPAKKIRTPIDKKKLIRNIIIIIMVVALLLSVAASLIYSIISYSNH